MPLDTLPENLILLFIQIEAEGDQYKGDPGRGLHPLPVIFDQPVELQTSIRSNNGVVDSVDDTVDPVDAVDPVDPLDPVDPVDLVDAVDHVDPVDPQDPVDLVDHVNKLYKQISSF